MKLTDAQIGVVTSAAGIAPIPAEHEFAAELARRFGEHTFYLGSGGLYVLEPFGLEVPGAEPAVFFRIAKWADETARDQLAPIEPERQEHAVDLAAGGD
jgi:hypothetical protein